MLIHQKPGTNTSQALFSLDNVSSRDRSSFGVVDFQSAGIEIWEQRCFQVVLRSDGDKGLLMSMGQGDLEGQVG